MSTPTTRPLPAEPDFEALGRRLLMIEAEIIHRPERSWTTDSDFHAQALRVLLEHASSGFVRYRECVDLINGHTVVDRMNAERADERAAQARALADRAMADSASHLAASLRGWCNEATVPSRYRREGVELAAGMLERMAAWHRARPKSAGLEAI